jgi:peptidase E
MSTFLFLGGGGDPPDSKSIDAAFASILNGRSLLFIVDAVAPEMWSVEAAVTWLKSNTFYANIPVVVKDNIHDISDEDMAAAGGIYIMGGNTFKLLDRIKKSGFDSKLKSFLHGGRPVFGLSAGAIIFGASIATAACGLEHDENLVGLENLQSLDLFSGRLIATHYKNEDMDALIALGRELGREIIAIPEQAGLTLIGTYIQIIGEPGAKAILIGADDVRDLFPKDYLRIC